MTKQDFVDPNLFPEAYSYGSNTLGAKDIFVERKKYNNFVFPDFLIPNFAKTWTNDRLYGTINNKGNATIPDVTQLKGLRFLDDDSQQLYAIKFVADAWADFVRRVRLEADNNNIFRNSPWADPKVTKAWVPVAEDYASYMRSEVFPAFYNGFLNVDNGHAKISGVESFINQFDRYSDLVLDKVGPLTLSGMIESSWNSRLSSGLIIEIAYDKYDDDFSKAYKFGDRNFSFIANLASQYGFSIDKNIPWRLVANIRSEALQEYMYGVPIQDIIVDNSPEIECKPLFGGRESPPQAFGFSQIPGFEDVIRHIAVYQQEGSDRLMPGYKEYQNIKNKSQSEVFEAVFSSAYIESWTQDMDLLSNYLSTFYNLYVEVRPTVALFKTRSTQFSCPPVQELVSRTAVSNNEFRKIYDERWALRTFYVCRLKERKIKLDEKRTMHELQQVMNFYNMSVQAGNSNPFNSTIRYIQEEFIGPADTNPLTLDTVGDTMNKKRGQVVFPNSGRQK